MPITVLPKDTSRAITSSLALNDAVSVVKELIDNALDARANTISIEISSNTLDVIQVKDNGTGVGVEDRQLLCKRGCTSKIRSLEDLASLGGTFLGFRGEALASVAELSRSVTIISRIDGEIVGSALKYGPEGKLLSSSSASHPVGTTVRIQEFLSKIPVRKQAALKATHKTLNSLRKLLYAYAFARPGTRFSFKVLKGRNDKANWSYAPSSNSASLSEIASKVVGKEISAQYKEHASQSSEDTEVSSWSVQALLLDPDLNIQEVPGGDQYFSVDNRPVSAERGVMRELSKLYKQYLRNSCEHQGGISCPSKPFLYVRITCPADSYDVNIEPAKDELLFYKPVMLRTLFEELLAEVYGTLKPKDDTQSSAGSTRKTTSANTASFDLLMARKTPKMVPVSPKADENQVWPAVETNALVVPMEQGSEQNDADHFAPPNQASNAPASPPRTFFNMYPFDYIDDELPLNVGNAPDTSSEARLEEEDGNIRDVSSNNPWTMAKMNVILSPRRSDVPPPQSVGDLNEATATNSPDRAVSGPANTHRTPLGMHLQLPSPATSPRRPSIPYQNPGPPSQTKQRHGRRLEESDEDSRASSAASPVVKPPSLLDMWMKQSQSASQQVIATRQPELTDDVLASQSSIGGPGYIQQSGISLPPETNPRPTQRSVELHQQRLKRPFKTPFKRPFKHASHSQSSTSGPEAEDSPSDHSHPDHLSTHQRLLKPATGTAPSHQRELDEILVFERQKRIVIAQQRKQAAQGTWNRPLILPSSSSSNIQPASAIHQRLQVQEKSQPDTPAEETFDDRFGMGNLASTSVLRPSPNNPHQNRYLAAIRALERPRPSPTHSHPIPAQRYTLPQPPKIDEQSPTISDSDPRGYLIHHNRLRAKQQQEQAPSNGVTRTGLKAKRTKTTRLPLESIPAHAATCNLLETVDAPTIGALKEIGTRLLPVDEYVVSGEVKDLQWTAEMNDVEEWRNTLLSLVQANYKGIDLAEIDLEEIDLDVNKAFERHLVTYAGITAVEMKGDMNGHVEMQCAEV